MDIKVVSKDSLLINGMSFECVIGKNGFTDDKKEGDWSTPTGRFLLRKLYFRPDKVQIPKTNLPIQALEPDDAWCDDPNHDHYNQCLKLPHNGSHEKLWHSDDDLYDLIIPIGFNDNPAVPGKGSAIFIHVAKPGMTPTAGCVALKKDDLLKIIPILDKDSQIIIGEH